MEIMHAGIHRRYLALPTALVIIAVFAMPSLCYGESLRTWTSTSGDTMEARYLDEDGNRVILEDIDGKQFLIHIENLVQDDRLYILDRTGFSGTGSPDAAFSGDSNLPPDELNSAIGLNIWDDILLWETGAEDLAAGLGWPMESKTSTSSSYRLYPANPVRVFDRPAYTMSLHAENGKPVSLSFMFANKGDVARMMNLSPDTSQSDIRRAYREYPRLIREDSRALNNTLDDLFGASAQMRIGDSIHTEERVNRWDWNGHVFLLSSQWDEYVSLRIVPSDAVDGSGLERISRGEIQSVIMERVTHRDNGDVILDDIPMVDQGPKGYCVPATWERVLRYMGIPADMYVLAMAGETGIGGGTSIRKISDGAGQLVRRHGRNIRTRRAQINEREIARYIDQGIPIIWTMFVVNELDSAINRRTRERQTVSDWDEWNDNLDTVRREARRIRTDPSQGHLCMIIGYNSRTGELAVSDSWGPAYAERWMTLEEAEAVSRGEFTIISP